MVEIWGDTDVLVAVGVLDFVVVFVLGAKVDVVVAHEICCVLLWVW